MSQWIHLLRKVMAGDSSGIIGMYIRYEVGLGVWGHFLQVQLYLVTWNDLQSVPFKAFKGINWNNDYELSQSERVRGDV